MSKPSFASGTKVPAEQTRLDIERLVAAHGADAFAFGAEVDRAQIRFRLEGRVLRFDLPLPALTDPAFTQVRRGAAGLQKRSPAAARTAWEKACRERWRALLLCIKAKLTAVEAGVVSFEEEFLAHVVMPDGRTVGDVVRRQLALSYADGESPPLLEHYTGGQDR